MRRPFWSTVVAAVALLVGAAAEAAPAHGQWIVEASAGGARHEGVAAGVGEQSAILSVFRMERRLESYLSAGVPLDQDGLPWAAAGLVGRLERPLSSFGIGLDWGAHGHAYRSGSLGATGAGLVGEALPFVAIDRGGVRLEAASGIVHYTSVFDGERLGRTLHDSALRGELRPLPALALTAEARLARAEERDYPYFAAAAELTGNRGSASAYVGRWTDAAIVEPVWGIGGSWEISRALAVRASYRQETNDPLYWTPPRRLWSVGLSARFGGGWRSGVVPVVPPAAPGGVRFEVSVSAARDGLAVGGDFNDWSAIPMTREGDRWTLTIPIPPGVYHYAFRRSDGSWFVPESVPNRVDDGFGGTNAVLIVPSGG